MKTSVYRTIILLVIFMIPVNFGHAFDLDETVDDEIRKNYNDSKLINDVGIKNIEEILPDLPEITKSTTNQKTPNIKSANSNTTPPLKQMNFKSGNLKVKKGTVFTVSNVNNISDWQKQGTQVKFSIKKPVNTKLYSIPISTIFNGEIKESHQPQITCNGGLVAISVYSMNINGQTYPINAYVTRANDKKVFFNYIKGNRTYLKTMWNKGGWGRNLFNKMLNLTIKLGRDTTTLILSPFPVAYGTICLSANAIISPITAFFSKGGHVSIPAGSIFKIKLAEDAYID